MVVVVALPVVAVAAVGGVLFGALEPQVDLAEAGVQVDSGQLQLSLRPIELGQCLSVRWPLKWAIQQSGSAQNTVRD